MKTKKIVLVVLVVLFVGVSASGVYFYKKSLGLKADPNVQAQKEVNDLVARVGKIIILPEGELPTIATVSDPEKLKDQAFFAKAKAGDKVLLYTNAKKAYLYDPLSNKILEIAPINLGTTPAVAPTITKTIKTNETTTKDTSAKPKSTQ